MNFINFLLAIIVVYFGLVSGLILRKFTRKEVEEGKKYFIFVQRLLVLIIIGLSMYFFKLQAIWIIAALFIISTGMYQIVIKTPVFYALFGVMIGLLAEDLNSFLVISSLVFLYGLVSGSLHEKSNGKYLAVNAIFFVSAILMYFA